MVFVREIEELGGNILALQGSEELQPLGERNAEVIGAMDDKAGRLKKL